MFYSTTTERFRLENLQGAKSNFPGGANAWGQTDQLPNPPNSPTPLGNFRWGTYKGQRVTFRGANAWGQTDQLPNSPNSPQEACSEEARYRYGTE
eukprot:5895729-Prymnesium_polylepis.1